MVLRVRSPSPLGAQPLTKWGASLSARDRQNANAPHTPDDLVAVGRDTETVALARAVKLHSEHRVFLYGNKTIIFR
jgi:hypothetical protein